MANHNDKGILGEELACNFLVKKGYSILERNWRYKKAEIDIIAMKDDVLIFIEVKTRKNANFGNPEEFVSEKKQKFMLEAAPIYMEKINHEWEIRFDIIGIVLRESVTLDIVHIEDAFYN
ncbi:MAG: YraN family protein, partial [Saprospiraceae bacterium]|nr:YraN family protein [Saprospiraceae bacterium]